MGRLRVMVLMSVLCLGVGCLAVSEQGLGPDHDGTLPEVIYTRVTPSDAGREKYPAFVAASVAFGDEGKLDRDLVQGDAADGLERFLALHGEESGCARFGRTFIDWPAFLDANGNVIPQSKVFIEDSELIVRGRLMGTRGGLLFGDPGTLYRLRVEAVLKGSSTLEELFFFVSHGRVSLAGRDVCPEPQGQIPQSLFPDRAEVVLMVPIYNGGEYLDLDHHPGRIVVLDDGYQGGFGGYLWSGFSEEIDAFAGEANSSPAAVVRFIEERTRLSGL